ncbi:probable LRR receptor-like serine/threonine-protein kinase At1g53430 [Mercurialis annua]|uniref:probable LRR receptor-like serine/threonine-protein kinase At1g53430 n=1 Tax=Mercurialis annua TaxID=3986 RepID=UPI00215EF1BD|nr:probable LRR receptor-like serine/threonine-protein kinase At1g53430 [Mercurialis annua]
MGFVRIVWIIAFGFLLLDCFVVEFCCQAQVSPPKVLPPEEVQILQTITTKMKNQNWTITETSCSMPEWNWTISSQIESTVTCDCNGTVCHVTNILLKGFNLTGIVPDELANLTRLVEIDFSRNVLTGTIPTKLAQLPNLQKLSFLGNRLNGSVPPQLGNIATLEQLVLEDNLLGGPLPPNLGNLRSLKRLLLSANNFTGTIPDTYGHLKNLTDFRIDGSALSGKIPEFIGNWTNITRLDLQGTAMAGPIPASISLLTELEELRISDLRGSSASFPNLQPLTKMERLILRNCLITGSIPNYLADMTALKQLDLSNNRLTGPIPDRFQIFEAIDYLFLTNNSLTGEIPGWILSNSRSKSFDVSYNNFTGKVSTSCQERKVNLVSSQSSANTNQVDWCFRQDLTCSRKPEHHSLFINCGGRAKTFENIEYEDDSTLGGPSNFFSVAERWAYSSTGAFMGKDGAEFNAGNKFNLSVPHEIYESARLAPQSLKYYALCMRQGSYKVRLHFAEIMYSDDQTFSSTGRRIFDVSIQGNVVLTDFNIMEKAGGVGKSYVAEYDNITVSGTTLEIHLYWLGKGTTAIPDRGVYGPLISAITVTPNFEVDTGGGLSAGAIVGIVAACCVVVLSILIVLRWKGCLGGKDLEDKELRGLDLQTGYFSLRQIKHATNNFDPANKIGEGGFGPVYKGLLSDGTIIAVKQLSAKSKQGNREFVNEIGMISALQHPNLVKLYGCCIEGNQLLLIYEYLENNSLARALFGPVEQRLNLDWSTRKKILLGIAKGLAYLHEESRLKIVHRDIKATNVLLDKDLNAKISDFGLAKLDEEENTHISTRIAGTIGYMAPEYAMRGYLTDKADVYSFGVVLLEIISGKSNTNYRPKEEFVYLLDWAYVLQEQGNLLELVDPVLESNFSKTGAMRFLNLALLCTNPSPTLRPSMSSVVSMIDGKIPVQAPIVKRNTADQDARFKAFEILSHDSQSNYSTYSQDHQDQKSISMDGPWIDSSVSLPSKDVSQDHSSSRLIKDLYDPKLE